MVERKEESGIIEYSNQRSCEEWSECLEWLECLERIDFRPFE